MLCKTNKVVVRRFSPATGSPAALRHFRITNSSGWTPMGCGLTGCDILTLQELRSGPLHFFSSASPFFWYGWAIRSRLAPVKKVARMCKSHLGNLLTFFEHRLTNGPMEGLNNAIQGLIKKAFGYRNRERFKTDIFFHFGGLDLYPAQ